MKIDETHLSEQQRQQRNRSQDARNRALADARTNPCYDRNSVRCAGMVN